MNLLRDLEAAVAPPARPVEPMGDGGWVTVESELRCSLPGDYKHYIESYGSGEFDGFLTIFNPFSKNRFTNLITQVVAQRRVLDQLRELDLFAKWPSGDVLPFGITANGDMCMWQMSGLPEQWTVNVLDPRSLEACEIPASFLGFLHSVVTGTRRLPVFPADFPGPHPEFKPFVAT